MTISTELKQALLLFTSDHNHTRCPYVFSQDGWLCATNGAAFAGVKNKAMAVQLAKPINIPSNLPSMILQKLDQPVFQHLKYWHIDFLDKALSRFSFEKEGNKVPCTECKAMGQVTARYQSSKGKAYSLRADCPVCGGSGQLILASYFKWKAKQAMEIAQQINYQGHLFDACYFKRMLEAAKLIGADNIVLEGFTDYGQLYPGQAAPGIFSITGSLGNIRVLLMPQTAVMGKVKILS